MQTSTEKECLICDIGTDNVMGIPAKKNMVRFMIVCADVMVGVG